MKFFPVNIFPNIDGPKVCNNIHKATPFSLLISCFTVSLTPSSNNPVLLLEIIRGEIIHLENY